MNTPVRSRANFALAPESVLSQLPCLGRRSRQGSPRRVRGLAAWIEKAAVALAAVAESEMRRR